MTEIQKMSQAALNSLRESVAEALDKKRRLGQYAVIWKDGKIAYLYDDELSEDEKQ